MESPKRIYADTQEKRLSWGSGFWNTEKRCESDEEYIRADLIEHEAEHQRLKDAVIERCQVYCQSVLEMEEHGYPRSMSADEWHARHLVKQTAMINAAKALIDFEAKHG